MTKHQSDKDFFLHDPTLHSILEQGHLEAKLELEDRYREIMEKPLLDGDDLINLPFETNDYLIENLLWKNDTVFILAQEKAGKSIFSFQMALSLTCGEPFLEMFDVARPMNILYVQAEGSLGETQDRIRRSIKSDRDDLTVIYICHSEDVSANGFTRTKIKTIGKMLDDKITLEGLFTIVLLAGSYKEELGMKYVFLTNSDGTTTAKSPQGMFAKLSIDNDMVEVLKKIKEYEG